MFDPVMVISDVQQNRYSPDWHVVHGKGKRALFVVLIVFIVSTGVCTAGTVGGALLVLSSILAAAHFVDAAFIWWIGPVLALLILGLISWLTIWLLRRNRAEDSSLLVFLPEGVVECYRGVISNITALHFDRIQNIAMDHQMVVTGTGNGVTSSTIYWLNVYDDRGGYVKWNIHDCYGDPATIAGNIIAAYQNYQRYQQQNMQHP